MAKSAPSLAAKDRFVIIMAGGRGERFWPLSREKTPKQLLTLLGNRSFLQQAADRVAPLVPGSNIFVITNTTQVTSVRRQLPQLPRENIVAEPCGRDTCAAVALGAALVGARNPGGVMAVLPADHVIPTEKAFQRVLADAFNLAGRRPEMVTIGIPPTEPATGYGYIKLGKPLETSAARGSRTTFHRADRFVEKPPLAKARAYLRNGGYRWNAGMFIWSFATISQGLKNLQPDLARSSDLWREAARKGSPALNRALRRDYPGLSKISVDFALMEKAPNVIVADGCFDWDDLGSWPALIRHLKGDSQGNRVVGDLIQVDASNNLVFDQRTGKRSPVALVGIHNTVVVLTNDAVLVLDMKQAQQLKQLVGRLGEKPAWKKLA